MRAMRLTVAVTLASLLAGCAPTYLPDTGHNYSDRMDCHYQAHAVYTSDRPRTLGILLGPIAGIVSDNTGTHKVELSDLDGMVDKCMADKGYTKVGR